MGEQRFEEAPVDPLDRLTYDEHLRLERARGRLQREAAATARLANGGELPTRWSSVSYEIEDLAEACRELSEAQREFWDLYRGLSDRENTPAA
jgi:hypothetical protein